MNKQAEVSDSVKQAIAFVWRQNEGFFENLFRIATYLMPFVPGVGWVTFILDKVSSTVLGLGIEDLGKWFDQNLNLSPGTDVTEEHFMSLEPNLTSTMEAKSSVMMRDGQMVKVAFLWGLLKLLGGGGLKTIWGKSWSVIKAAMGFLMLTFGASSMNQLYQNIDQYKAQAKQKATELATNAIKDQMFGGDHTISDLKSMLT